VPGGFDTGDEAVDVGAVKIQASTSEHRAPWLWNAVLFGCSRDVTSGGGSAVATGR